MQIWNFEDNSHCIYYIDMHNRTKKIYWLFTNLISSFIEGLDGGYLVLSDDLNILSNMLLIMLSLILLNEEEIWLNFCPSKYNNWFWNSIKNHLYLSQFLRYRNDFVHFSTQNFMGFQKMSIIFILDFQEDEKS